MDTYKNMNARDREIAWCYCSTKYGNKCCNCGKSIEELSDDWQIKHPTEQRTNPILIVDHDDDDSRNNDYINWKWLCYSCNKRKNPFKTPVLVGSPRMTREKQDNLKGKPEFYRRLHIYLIDNDEICYNQMLAVGCRWGNIGSQVTVDRWFKLELLTDANKEGKFQNFPFNCGNTLCNGDHVCLKGFKPTKLIEQEKRILEQEWKQQYAGYDPNHTAWQGTSVPPLDEYIKTHGRLVTYDFK